MAAAGMMAQPVRNGFQGYPQHYAMYQPRSHHPQVDASQSMPANPYAHYAQAPQHPAPQPAYGRQPAPRSPQASGSPSSEDGFKPSLPSISNLLGIADRPGQDSATRPVQVLSSQHEQPQSTQQAPQEAVDNGVVSRYAAHGHGTSPRSVVQPPPFRNDSVLEGTHSPSTISSGSAVSEPYFVGSAINNVEPSDQRVAPSQVLKRQSVPSQPNVSPYGNTRYTTSPYAMSPAAVSAPSYYSPTEPNYPAPSGLYQQRPLPSNFPPSAPVTVQSTSNLPTSNPWEHHHYISPSSQATFPQSQDRYICPTCSKAFSRPSSLKIHSHSHTGEKPFRCPHTGCGKAFSVRSNMKRHERGCHGGMAGAHPLQPPHAHPHSHPHAHPHPHALPRMM